MSAQILDGIVFSAEIKEDLLLLLMRIEGCEQEWFNIVTADELNKKWFISAVPTTSP